MNQVKRLIDEHRNDEYIAGTRQWRDEAVVELEKLYDEYLRIRSFAPGELEELNDALCEENEVLRAVLAEALEGIERLQHKIRKVIS